MRCPAAQDLIEAYVDGELDASERPALRTHLEGCIACSEIHWRLQELRTGIRRQLPYFEAPSSLRAKVLAAVGGEARRPAPPRTVPWKWMALAASVFLAVSAAWNVLLVRSREHVSDSVASQVLDSHLRSLIGTHLLDVPSSDQHTVKPWFNGKVDFSPQVKDLASEGFPLLGGRIEYIQERPVAALVYGRRKHLIGVFEWPSSAAPLARPEEFHRRGYNLIEWTGSGMTWWAVSDVNENELREFVRKLGGPFR